MMKLLVATIVLALFSTAYGKVFTKCELAKILTKEGFPASQIPDLICIAQNESGFNTAALNTKNTNGSRDYGMFQINDKYWCSPTSTPGKDCNNTCANLLNDNILDDLQCVRVIYARHGFSAWVAWVNKCKGQALPSVSECFSG